MYELVTKKQRDERIYTFSLFSYILQASTEFDTP